MKFFHISDLHLGKRVNEFSMIDNQSDILQKIVLLAKEHKPDAILIAGDVYDKSMPTVEAVQLLDRFLVWLNELNTIPGSLSFYLWEPMGIKYSELLDRLISLALKRKRQEDSIIYSFDTNILSLGGGFGSKGK